MDDDARTVPPAYRRSMSMKILDVGQCGVDGPRMMDLFKAKLGAQVENAGDAREASRKIQQGAYDIVLINREFAADGGSGIELIRSLRETGVDVPLMLVSDHDDAQEEAVAAGAARGFGKSALSEPATLELIRSTAGA